MIVCVIAILYQWFSMDDLYFLTNFAFYGSDFQWRKSRLGDKIYSIVKKAFDSRRMFLLYAIDNFCRLAVVFAVAISTTSPFRGYLTALEFIRVALLSFAFQAH